MKRHGRTETRILYWFRTPPYIKVGRTALDEEAMRFLEERHPDVPFDWDRILRDPPQQIPEEQALRRREHRDAREAKRKKKRPADVEILSGASVSTEGGTSADVPFEAEALEPVESTDESELSDYPNAEDPQTVAGFPASEVLGPQAAAHLRNRYVVLMQRIERHPDETKREVLKKEAAGLDPTSWDTAEVVRATMEGYEAVYQRIRAQVGGGRRRRRRKRGRGRSGAETPPPGESPPNTDV